MSLLKKIITTVGCVIFHSCTLFAQAHPDIYLFATQVSYRDQISVRTAGIPASKILDPHNPTSTLWGIGLSYPIKKLRVRLEYRNGRRRYSYNATLLLDNFDPEATQSLKGNSISTGEERALAYNLIAGHIGREWTMNSKWTFSAYAGVSVRVFQDNALSDSKDSVHLAYKRDNRSNVAIPSAITVETGYGRSDEVASKIHLNSLLYSWELYLGVSRNVKLPVINKINIGIEAARSITNWQRHPAVTVKYMSSINEKELSENQFIDRNISVGLRLGLSLWK